jgi:peptidyl-prolyl cis-trans isomerase SurA
MMLRVAVLVPTLVALSSGGLHAQNPTDSSAAPPAAAPPAVTPPAVTPAPIDTVAPPRTQPPSQSAASPGSPAPSPNAAPPANPAAPANVAAPANAAAPPNATPPANAAPSPGGAPSSNAQPGAPAGERPLIPAQIEDVGAPGGGLLDSTAAGSTAAQSAPAPSAGPQAPLRDTTFVVDKVVAVVGNRPILASQVDEEIFSRQSQGLKLPTSPEGIGALRKQVIQGIIDDELLVQEAERDTTIKVTDQEVADGVEEQIKKIRSNFSSEFEYASELRKAGFQTPEEYRRWLTDQQRRAALQNRLVEERRGSGKLKPVIPTEREMREYFEQQKGNLEKRPATMSFHQIVIAPQPSAESRQRAYGLADSIAQGLRRGGDFAVAAKRFSMDSGSRELGGSLNWFRRGTMVPEFERVAFALKPGVISDPVETPFGFHVIQVERAQPGEIQARHILIMPEITEQEGDSADRLAEGLLRMARAGASFDSLQRIYHDKSEEREARDVQLNKLPPAYAQATDTASEGSTVGPFPLSGSGNRVKYTILRITSRRPEGDVRYEDVRDKIRQQLGEQLAVRRYLDTLRKKAYIDVRS